MTIEQITQWSSLLIAIGAFVVAWRKGGGEARKLEADAAGSLSGTALNLVRELEKKLETERKEYAHEIETERKLFAEQIQNKQLEFEKELNRKQAEFEARLNTLGTELLSERQARRKLDERVTQLESEKEKLELIKIGLENDRRDLTSENGRLKSKLEEYAKARRGSSL